MDSIVIKIVKPWDEFYWFRSNLESLNPTVSQWDTTVPSSSPSNTLINHKKIKKQWHHSILKCRQIALSNIYLIRLLQMVILMQTKSPSLKPHHSPQQRTQQCTQHHVVLYPPTVLQSWTKWINPETMLIASRLISDCLPWIRSLALSPPV